MPTKPTLDESRRRLIRWTGARIRAARLVNGLTQDAVSRQLGYSSGQWLSDIERGVNDISAHDLRALADILSYPIEYFLDPAYDRQRPAPPRTFEDWLRLYPEDPPLARLLAGVARTYLHKEEELPLPARAPSRNLKRSLSPGIIARKPRSLAFSQC